MHILYRNILLFLQTFINVNQYSRFPSEIFFTHSIKTPLTTLLLSLDSLDTKKVNHAQNDQAMQVAQNSIKQIINLVESIPHIDQIERTIRPSTFCLKDALQQLQVIHSSKKDVSIVCNLQVKKTIVRARLQKLFFLEMMNCLINNAIESYQKKAKNKVVIISVIERKKRIDFQVQDFGKGIDRLRKMLISRRGFTTKKTGQGFGMWFVRQVVKRHLNGNLRVVSETGEGTIVRFSLPKA